MKPLAVAVAILTASACTPPASPTTCHAAVDAYWPASSKAWAHRIVQRESRGIATAQNPRSSAAGCAQLLKVHAPRFTKLGYHWSDRYNATANIKVALDLYRQVGKSPWATS